jgi:hypothetical protein
MCGRIPETAKIPRSAASRGRSRTRHCVLAHDSDGRRDKLARLALPCLKAAGARGTDAIAAAVILSGLGHRPRCGFAPARKRRPAPIGRSSTHARGPAAGRVRPVTAGRTTREQVSKSVRVPAATTDTPGERPPPSGAETRPGRAPPLSLLLCGWPEPEIVNPGANCEDLRNGEARPGRFEADFDRPAPLARYP